MPADPAAEPGGEPKPEGEKELYADDDGNVYKKSGGGFEKA